MSVLVFLLSSVPFSYRTTMEHHLLGHLMWTGDALCASRYLSVSVGERCESDRVWNGFRWGVQARGKIRSGRWWSAVVLAVYRRRRLGAAWKRTSAGCRISP